jgi:hypothetical protein
VVDDRARAEFEELYRHAYPRVVAQVTLLTGSRAAAEDAVQEAFARAWNRWGRLAGFDQPQAWVRRVAMNVAVSRWRSLRRQDHPAAPRRRCRSPRPLSGNGCPGPGVTAPPLASVRARARRRRQLGAAGVLAVAVVAAGIVVPIALLHNGSGDGLRTHFLITPPSQPPSTSTKYPLPAVGAAGFPASVYPLSHRGLHPGSVTTCPSAAGLQAPTSQTRRTAVAISKLLDSGSFLSDLRATDRAYWPAIASTWRHHRYWQTPTAPLRPSHAHILHTGMLSAPWPGLGVPDPKNWVRESCGAAVMRRSYVVAAGPPQSGALQQVEVFVVRGGRPLLYFSYP